MQRFSNKVTVGLLFYSCLWYSMTVSCRLGESLDGYSSGSGEDASPDSQDSSLPSEANPSDSGGTNKADSDGVGGSGGAGGSGGTGGGGVVEGPSCDGLAKTCGNESNKSCCSSLRVPGGSVLMGRSHDGSNKCPSAITCDADEQPEHEVTVSEFFLDEFEVTVGRFRKFVEKYDQAETRPKAGAGAHPKIDGSGWKREWDGALPDTTDALKSELKCIGSYDIWRDTAGDTEQHPINCVSWYIAFAFCAWDGGRLPTEAEWEYAAAGGDKNRLYPWGSEPPNDTRVTYGCLYDGNLNTCSLADMVKVGMLSAGQGRWGHKELAGNMWEWVLDWYDVDWYGRGDKERTDCANLDSASERTKRGGSFNNGVEHLRAASRSCGSPAIPDSIVSIRCARTP